MLLQNVRIAWWRSSPPNDFRVRIRVEVKVRVKVRVRDRTRVRVGKLGGELLHQRPHCLKIEW